MLEAGDRVVECHRVLSNSGDNIVGEFLKGVETFFEWNHYPDGDVYDSNTHSQYYYHAHPSEERGNEHGHFHTFLRPDGMPSNIKPAKIENYVAPDDPDDALSHLIGISMDSAGLPIKLFTTNRWVTGEVWYRGADVKTLASIFNIDHAQPSWPVNMWVSSMVALFQPQIAALIDARDVTIENWGKSYTKEDVFEDRALEITSELLIDVDSQISILKE
ncbi:MAG: hypothetical protein JKY20_00635 [Alphaproteobacteria bacterium]|nr:hypothetical protein [Alphaproteobacteria bacterium]